MKTVEPIIVVVDTREQEPYAFDPRELAVVRRALPAGDYSLEGHEAALAIERKTLEDFVASVIRDKDRFGRELRLFSGYELACIVVERHMIEAMRACSSDSAPFQTKRSPRKAYSPAAITPGFNIRSATMLMPLLPLRCRRRRPRGRRIVSIASRCRGATSARAATALGESLRLWSHARRIHIAGERA